MIHNVLVYAPNGETVSHFIDRGANASLSVEERKSMDLIQRELLTQKYQLLLSRCDLFDVPQRDVLSFIRKYNLPTETIVIAKKGSVEDAVEAMKLGAGDFVVAQSLTPEIVESIIPERFNGSDIVSSLNEKPFQISMIGESDAMKEVQSAVTLVADSSAAVLITGESGTGKEVVARLIHSESKRRLYPFVALNCAALPKDVIENELFGHEKGAFTGATGKKFGAFELASGGTIFFDEIAEMNPDTQAKLLRAIE
ncbi:MAG TPA: sigma 54-interacting transcriptional regulator, partial [Bacteroidota bacterium]|nr:sigma 54-interacting transcriptional regulator [Bacteroidota bacterium]